MKKPRHFHFVLVDDGKRKTFASIMDSSLITAYAKYQAVILAFFLPFPRV